MFLEVAALAGAQLMSEHAEQFRAAANDALAVLSQRLSRLQDKNVLAGRTVAAATIQFHALCEGLAALELREALPGKDAERIWRDAFTALIAGFAADDGLAERDDDDQAEALGEVPGFDPPALHAPDDDAALVDQQHCDPARRAGGPGQCPGEHEQRRGGKDCRTQSPHDRG